MRILRLEPGDVIIPPFAIIAVTVASQGETLLLTLFTCFCFVARTVQPFVTAPTYRPVSGIGKSRFRIAC